MLWEWLCLMRKDFAYLFEVMPLYYIHSIVISDCLPRPFDTFVPHLLSNHLLSNLFESFTFESFTFESFKKKPLKFVDIGAGSGMPPYVKPLPLSLSLSLSLSLPPSVSLAQTTRNNVSPVLVSIFGRAVQQP